MLHFIQLKQKQTTEAEQLILLALSFYLLSLLQLMYLFRHMTELGLLHWPYWPIRIYFIILLFFLGGGGRESGGLRWVEALQVQFGHSTTQAQLFYKISHNRHVTLQLAYRSRRMTHFSVSQLLLTA